MDIVILGLVAFACATIAFAAIAYERRMDILYGPYIQARARGFSVKRLWRPGSSAIDRLRALESQKMIYPVYLIEAG
jgi:hypothetical protein